MKIVFQGESYEDPNPPEEDAADKKKKKDPNEPEVRMITPDPIVLEGELGREFEFELGRNEQVKIEKTPNESQKNVEADGAAEGEEEEAQYETKWIQYKLDQSGEDLLHRQLTYEGKLQMTNLMFQLDDNFKGGLYELSIKDVTSGLDESKLLPTLKADLKVFDSVAEAELAAANAAAGKGKKK